MGGARARRRLRARRHRRRDFSLPVFLGPLPERPYQLVGPADVAGEANALQLEEVGQLRQVNVRVGRVPRDLRRLPGLADGLHDVVVLAAAAVERAGHVGHAEGVVGPQHVAARIGEAPLVHPGEGRDERAFQLAPGAAVGVLEKAERAGEIALPHDREVHRLEVDVLLDREIDVRAHVVEHLRPFGEVDVAGDVGVGAGALQVDVFERDLALVDPEPRLHVGAELFVILDPDRAVAELRGAAIGVAPLEHADVEIVADDFPRHGVVVIDEQASARVHLFHRRGHLPDRVALLFFRLGRDARKIVLAGKLLDQHLPVAHVDVVHDQLVGEGRPPRHVDEQVLRLEEWTIGRLQAFDDEVVDLERAGAEMDAELADMHRPLEIFRSRVFRLLLQRRAEVDDQAGDDHRGDDRDEDAERAENGMRPAARCGRSGLRRGFGRRRLRWDLQVVDHSTMTSTRPASTEAPALTATSLTRPALGERNSFSIFIASTTTTGCRASTASPISTSTRTTRPGIGAITFCSPCASVPVSAAARPVRRPLTTIGTVRPERYASSSPGAEPGASETRSARCDCSANNNDRPNSPLRCASTSVLSPSIVTRKQSGLPARSTETDRMWPFTSTSNVMLGRGSAPKPGSIAPCYPRSASHRAVVVHALRGLAPDDEPFALPLERNTSCSAAAIARSRSSLSEKALNDWPRRDASRRSR